MLNFIKHAWDISILHTPYNSLSRFAEDEEIAEYKEIKELEDIAEYDEIREAILEEHVPISIG